MSSLAELNKKCNYLEIPLHNFNCQVPNCDFDSAVDAGRFWVITELIITRI